MNRTWPGDPEGNDTARLSHALYQAVVRHCTRCLDFHSWSKFTATCALVRGDVALSDQMGAVSGVLFQMEVPPPPPVTGGVPIGRLFNDHGMGSLTIELAPQWVIREREVSLGLQAAVNIARLCGLFDGEPVLSPTPPLRFAQAEVNNHTHILTAPCSGLFVETGLATSDFVTAGQTLGHLLRDDTLETLPLVSPVDGYLWQYGCHREHSDVALPPQHPYASEGDILATIMPR
jgi:predicted deacylase